MIIKGIIVGSKQRSSKAAKQQSTKQQKNRKTTKFDPEWGRGQPKSTKNRAKIETNALNHPKWLPDGSQDPKSQCPPTILSNFWVPLGALKSTKNQLFAKKGAPRKALLLIFVANVVFRDFLVDFLSIFHEKSMKKSTCFFTTARVVFELATLTKHYILRYESYFLFF